MVALADRNTTLPRGKVEVQPAKNGPNSVLVPRFPPAYTCRVIPGKPTAFEAPLARRHLRSWRTNSFRILDVSSTFFLSVRYSDSFLTLHAFHLNLEYLRSLALHTSELQVFTISSETSPGSQSKGQRQATRATEIPPREPLARLSGRERFRGFCLRNFPGLPVQGQQRATLAIESHAETPWLACPVGRDSEADWAV